MKEIKAIIQPFMFDQVLHALASIEGLPGVTVSKVIGWGQARGRGARDRVVVSGHAFAKKTKLELVVADEMAQEVIDAIARAAHTGRPGDGKIFVYEVGESVKIRTGEHTRS